MSESKSHIVTQEQIVTDPETDECRHSRPIVIRCVLLQDGSTPLFAAAIRGDKAAVEALLAAGAKPDSSIETPAMVGKIPAFTHFIPFEFK